MPRQDTSLSRARTGERPTESAPAKPDHGENSASTIIEAPQPAPSDPRGRSRLDAHEFPDGGGSGGAQAYRRRRRRG